MNDKPKKPSLPPLWSSKPNDKGRMPAGCTRCGDLEKILGDLLSQPVTPACGECHLTKHSKPSEKSGEYSDE